jgi:hypothetical protein
MRMHMRRFIRLTNAVFPTFETHARMIALQAVWYSFGRVDQNLRVSPASAAGVADRLWSMEDPAEREASLPEARKRGSCKKGVI